MRFLDSATVRRFAYRSSAVAAALLLTLPFDDVQAQGTATVLNSFCRRNGSSLNGQSVVQNGPASLSCTYAPWGKMTTFASSVNGVLRASASVENLVGNNGDGSAASVQ